jgi:hypothetical protein
VSLLQVEKDPFEGLFKKTATTPYLYWLPLAKQSIAAKENKVQRSVEKAEKLT